MGGMAQRTSTLVLLIAVVSACRRATPPAPDSRPAAVTAAVTAAEAGADVEASALDAGPTVTRPDDVLTLEAPGGPAMTVRTVGGAVIELTTDSTQPWKKVEIERRPAAGAWTDAGVQRDTLERSGHRDGARTGRRLHAATPGVVYTYRARSAGAGWSPDVTVRSPVSTAPPPAPSSLTARATSPYAVQLEWASEARGAFGFEVEVKVKDAFDRAALVDPTERALVHHFRLPGQVLAYRVRAFNSRGASAPSPVATITMPERAPYAKAPPPGPCVPKPSRPPPSSGCNPGIETIVAAAGHVVLSVPGPGNGCRRHLLGDYAGCTRELGVFELQADIRAVEGHTNEGWPLLRAIAGAGLYVGAQIQTLEFARGRYSIADEAFFCGERPEEADDLTTGRVARDLTRCAPPFEGCQLDPSGL